MSNSAASRILSHLTDSYLSSYNCPTDPSALINEFGLSIPFKGRESLLDAASKVYQARMESRGNKDRRMHPIGVIGGVSGIGKSRALLELAKEVCKWKKDDEWIFSVVVSYNNGNPPILDRRMTASKAFALRILYFGFVASNPQGVSFATFVDNFDSNLKHILEPHDAIDVILLHQQLHYHSDAGVIFLGVDESNYLLDSDYNGQVEKRSFLRDTMIAVASTMFHLKHVFVFPVVAGTTILPLNTVFADSSLKIVPLPISLLDINDSETIVDEMAKVIPGLQNWRTCRVFRGMLADFASIPVRAEELLSYVRKQTIDGTPLQNVDFDMLYHQFINSYSYMQIPREIILKLIADIMLERPVSRHEFLGSGKYQDYYYGSLESSGFIALATTPTASLLVQMPLAYFCTLVSLLDGNDALTVCLRKACNLIRNQNSAFCGLYWQSFEDFHCNMEAIREMLLARSEQSEDNDCAVSRLYCIERLENDFEFKLRRNITVVESARRFPRQNMSDSETIGHDAYMKNAPGAAFDSFTFRQLGGDDKYMLFCGQQKLYCHQMLNLTDIKAEVTKVEEALVSSGFDNEYLLVIFASKVNSAVSHTDLPEKCCLVTGKAWTTFYSSLFAARAHIIFDANNSQVNINTATKVELRNIDGIGSVIADRIITNRIVRPFDDWDDVQIRVNKIPKKVERYIKY